MKAKEAVGYSSKPSPAKPRRSRTGQHFGETTVALFAVDYLVSLPAQSELEGDT